jgi:hypothetical protein
MTTMTPMQIDLERLERRLRKAISLAEEGNVVGVMATDRTVRSVIRHIVALINNVPYEDVFKTAVSEFLKNEKATYYATYANWNARVQSAGGVLRVAPFIRVDDELRDLAEIIIVV